MDPSEPAELVPVRSRFETPVAETHGPAKLEFESSLTTKYDSIPPSRFACFRGIKY